MNVIIVTFVVGAVGVGTRGQEWIGKGYGSQLKTPDDHLSKMFKKALRSIGADEKKHFHSLRHTFAVRRLIQGESIFQLKLMMGHSSVTTTEGYANMNMKRVKQDFPTLVSAYVNDGNGNKVVVRPELLARVCVVRAEETQSVTLKHQVSGRREHPAIPVKGVLDRPDRLTTERIEGDEVPLIHGLFIEVIRNE